MKKFAFMLVGVVLLLVILIGANIVNRKKHNNLEKKINAQEVVLKGLTRNHFHYGDFFQKGGLYYRVTSILDRWVITRQAGTLTPTNYYWNSLDLISAKDYFEIRDPVVIKKLLDIEKRLLDNLGAETREIRGPFYP